MITTGDLHKKYKGLPSGGWIEYYFQMVVIRENNRLIETKVDHRDHYSVTGKILSSVSTNGLWVKRKYDDQDRIVYYENTRFIKTFDYYVDESGTEQRNFTKTFKT